MRLLMKMLPLLGGAALLGAASVQTAQAAPVLAQPQVAGVELIQYYDRWGRPLPPPRYYRPPPPPPRYYAPPPVYYAPPPPPVYYAPPPPRYYRPPPPPGPGIYFRF